ncbi:hypothetical protein T492DRAFT_1063287 [Pavlovales sp. CCMP2436]|nr:hypothetical protein T492DRAFT_1063287 [Pavlovales sp. CCMP2436]
MVASSSSPNQLSVSLGRPGSVATLRPDSSGYGFTSRKANPPDALRHRPAWRPATSSFGADVMGSHVKLGSSAGSLSKGQSAHPLTKLYSSSSQMLDEQKESREQLRVDALRRAARESIAAHADQLASLRAAKECELAQHTALLSDLNSLLANLREMDDVIFAREQKSESVDSSSGKTAENNELGAVPESVLVTAPVAPIDSKRPGSSKSQRPESQRPGSSKSQKGKTSRPGSGAKASKPPPKAAAKPPPKAAKPKVAPAKGAKVDDPIDSTPDVADAADALTDELACFFFAAYLPSQLASSAATDLHDALAHELDECRKDLAGYARVRESGIIK